jgi:hypothetical protein
MEPSPTPTPDFLAVESRRSYVVYDPRTGAIAHVHQAIVHRGATGLSEAENEARALELARQFGHRGAGLRVLRAADDLDTRVPQRVDVKAGRIVPARPAAPPRAAAKPSRAKGAPARAAASGSKARRRRRGG